VDAIGIGCGPQERVWAADDLDFDAPRGRAAFDNTVELYSPDKIELRQGARIVEKSERG
jgi:hypothetical protein